MLTYGRVVFSGLVVLLAGSSTACGGGDGSGGDGDGGRTAQASDWEAAEGQWNVTERAIAPECEAEVASLAYVSTEPECVILELGDYRGTPLLLSQDCPNDLARAGTSYELVDGRMLGEPLEYFAEGTAESPCSWTRSQYELILEEGQPYIVFWLHRVDWEEVETCPDELPAGAEPECSRIVYPLEPAGD